MVGDRVDQWRLRIRPHVYSDVAQLQPEAGHAGLHDRSALRTGECREPVRLPGRRPCCGVKSTGPCCQEKGQFYGNMYTWSFKTGWQNNIDTPGVKQVTIWKDFFTSLPWQDLVPDQDHSVVTAGFGTDGDIKQTQVSKSDYATTSKTPDGAFVVAYMPAARTISVNMASLKANTSAKWFDPTNGSSTPISPAICQHRNTAVHTTRQQSRRRRRLGPVTGCFEVIITAAPVLMFSLVRDHAQTIAIDPENPHHYSFTGSRRSW